jgi:hypothetical protein
VSVSLLASSTSHGGHQMSLLGFVLFIVVGGLGFLRLWRAKAQARRMAQEYQDAQTGSAPASMAPPAAAYWNQDQSPATDQRQARGGWASSVAAALSALLFAGGGLWAMVDSGRTLWAAHTGIPAQVTITDCQSRSRSGFDTCTAEWRQPDGTQTTLTVKGYDIPARNIVEVHIHGDQAYTQSDFDFTGLLAGFVLVSIFPALWLWGRRRRSRQPQAFQSDVPGRSL